MQFIVSYPKSTRHITALFVHSIILKPPKTKMDVLDGQLWHTLLTLNDCSSQADHPNLIFSPKTSHPHMPIGLAADSVPNASLDRAPYLEPTSVGRPPPPLHRLPHARQCCCMTCKIAAIPRDSFRAATVSCSSLHAASRVAP